MKRTCEMTCVLVLPHLNESRLENRLSNRSVETVGGWLYGSCLNFTLMDTTKDQVEMFFFMNRWVEILDLRVKARLI